MNPLAFPEEQGIYDLTGEIAPVTGTARHRGMGCQMALRSAQEGAGLVVSDKSSRSSSGLGRCEMEEYVTGQAIDVNGSWFMAP